MEFTIKLQKQTPMFSVKTLTLNNTTDPAITEGKIDLNEQDIAEINIINAGILEGTIKFGSAKEEKEFTILLKKSLELNDIKNKSIESPEKHKTINLSLAKGRIIWESTDGAITLNSFQDKNTISIDLSTLSTNQKREILTAIDSGQLKTEENEIQKIVSTTKDIDSMFEEYDDTFIKFVRFTLDAPIDQFKTLFEKGFKHEHLVLIKKIEEKEKNRKEYLEILNKALLTIK